MMEILTKTSVALQKASRRNKVTATIGKEDFYISSQAMEDLKLVIGMKLVFVVDMGRLYFYVARIDYAEGFILRIGSRLNVGMGKVSGRLLCKVLRERFPQLKLKNNACHPVRLSNTQINEFVTFEVLVDKKP